MATEKPNLAYPLTTLKEVLGITLMALKFKPTEENKDELTDICNATKDYLSGIFNFTIAPDELNDLVQSRIEIQKGKESIEKIMKKKD